MRESESETDNRRKRRSGRTMTVSSEARTLPEVWAGTIARCLLLLLVLLLSWASGGVDALRWAWFLVLAALLCWILAPEVRPAPTVYYPLVLIPLTLALAYG